MRTEGFCMGPPERPVGTQDHLSHTKMMEPLAQGKGNDASEP